MLSRFIPRTGAAVEGNVVRVAVPKPEPEPPPHEEPNAEAKPDEASSM
jgi:hypothetical protein